MKLKPQDLNLNALYHFHIVAKHQSLSRAATELHLSPPAVTHSLNNLEDSVGRSLCIRHRSAFSLTSAGLSLYQTTQKIFQEIEQFSDKQIDENLFEGLLSIGTLDHFEHAGFQSALQKTIKKFPKVKLNLQSYDSDSLNKLLLEREVDIAFGVFSHHSPRIKYIKIGEEKLAYYISKNHSLFHKKKITKDDLIGQKVTWLDNHNRRRSDLELNIFIENLKYKMQFFGFTNNLSGALHILLSGHTVVPLPEDYGHSLEKQYPVRRLDIETKAKILDQELAYYPSQILTPALKYLVEAF